MRARVLLTGLMLAICTACGGTTRRGQEESNGGAGGGFVARPPSACATFAQFFCEDYAELKRAEPAARCFCDPHAPASAADCTRNDYRCEWDFCEGETECMAGLPREAGCTCASGRPDCPWQQQACESYSPRQGCVCDPARPLSPDECTYSFQFVCDWRGAKGACQCLDVLPGDPDVCAPQERAAENAGLHLDCHLVCPSGQIDHECSCACVG